MKILLFSLILLTSCVNYQDTQKYLVINNVTKYKIIKAEDSCEYYSIKLPSGYSAKDVYLHYPQCTWCKKHK